MRRPQAALVLGVGARTPLGLRAAPSAAAVRAGISRASSHPFMIDTAGESMVVARASYLDGISGVERYLALAEPAAFEALEHLPNARLERPLPVVVGMPPVREGLPPQLHREFANELTRRLARAHPIERVEVIAKGHSSGLMAVEQAVRRFAAGMDELCLVGGVDSYLEPETLEWLEACEQLHSAGPRNNAWGFIPGEASGFLLLAAPNSRFRGSRAASVVSIATENEPSRIKTNDVCLGLGLTKAFERVFDAAGLAGRSVDQVICDMNGEPYRADEYGFASLRTDGYFIDSGKFFAPADCWGDVGAASGPLFANLAIAAAKRGYARGHLNLLWTSSESGERSAALLDTSEIAPEVRP